MGVQHFQIRVCDIRQQGTGLQEQWPLAGTVCLVWTCSQIMAYTHAASTEGEVSAVCAGVLLFCSTKGRSPWVVLRLIALTSTVNEAMQSDRNFLPQGMCSEQQSWSADSARQLLPAHRDIKSFIAYHNLYCRYLACWCKTHFCLP